MYIHEFCGAGIECSLWKTGFLLQSEHDRQRIVDSLVTELWINVGRGVDYDDLQPPAASLQSVISSDSVPRVTLDQELSRAVKLCSRSKAAVEKMFTDLRMGLVIETVQVTELVTEISDSLMRHPDALISLARLKTSDEYTYMHSVAVCALMIALARQLDLPANVVHEAGVAGLMHDIGKAAIPISILTKPGKLCDGEFNTMRGHPEAGVQMLSASSHFSARVLDVCLHHHERFDGSGYPHKLAGSQISLFARMGAVCDVYDAVTSDRPYKKAWNPADSIHRMAAWKGHFDEKVFQAFVKCVGIYPLGALVRLESGLIGVVTEQHKTSLLTPIVSVFYSAIDKRAVLHTTVDLAALAGQDRIVGLECAEKWGFKNLDQLWSGLSIGKKSHFD